MSRRVLLFTLAGLLAVVVAVTGFLTVLNPDDDPAGRGAAAAPEQPRSPSPAELEQLSLAVTSGSVDQLRDVFVVPPGQRLQPAFVTELRGWRQLRLEAETYSPLEEGVGTVEGTLVPASGAPSQWVLTLQLLDGMWRILTTEAVPS